MSKPSVVVLGPSSERYKGGIAQFTRYLVDTLRHSSTVEFYSWYQMYPPFLISRDFNDAVSQSEVGESDANYTLGYLNPLSWLVTAYKMSQQRPEKTYLTWIHPVHAPVYIFLCFFLKLFSKGQISFICHNVLPHESFPGARVLTKLCLSFADELIVHGKSEAKQAEELGAKNIQTLFLPLHNFFQKTDTDKKVLIESDSTTTTLLAFGNIRHYKGVDLLLHALHGLKDEHPHLRLHIAGELFYEKDNSIDIPKLVQELQLSDIVQLDLRYIPNEEIPHIFEQADLAVFPYRSASQSGSLTVAYSFGVPVIATKVGGLPDVVIEGESGYLADPTVESLQQSIRRFLRNPICEEQVLRVADSLSWERYVHLLDVSLLGGE